MQGARCRRDVQTVGDPLCQAVRRLFEMGFAEQLRAILSGMPASRQTLLFSATMPRALSEFARAGLREPTLIRLDAETKISPDLGLAFFAVRCGAWEKTRSALWLWRFESNARRNSNAFELTFTITRKGDTNIPRLSHLVMFLHTGIIEGHSKNEI